MSPPETPAAAVPVLMLLHGATLNAAMWNPVRRHLDPRWRVHAIDLPGHGARRTESFTLAGAVEAVAAAAREAAPAPVVLIGDSLGGYTAMAAADALPREQLIGLVVGGCSQNVTDVALTKLRLKSGLFRVLIPLLGEERLIRGNVAKLLRRLGHSQADIDAMIAAGIHLGVFPQAVEALAGVDFLARVARIPQPILFFNGEQDKGAVSHEASFVASAPNASSHRFACEHGVTLWCAAEFAAMVNEFVKRIAAGGRT